MLGKNYSTLRKMAACFRPDPLNCCDISLDYRKLTFIQPDNRFFVDSGQRAEERIAFVLRILEGFGNDPEGISEFMNRVYMSHDVVFAFIYGSAVNSNLALSKIEDIDILVVTQGDKKFVYEWDAPKGTEIRYLRLSEIIDFLKVEKRFFSSVFTKEYNSLGGIFVSGLVVIKGSRDLDAIVTEVRQNFHKIHIKALSQIVENDCRKRIEKNNKFTKTKRGFSSNNKMQYSFYGSECRVTLDEARSMIDESIKRKNIQPGKAPAIARKILKRIKMRGRC